MNTNNITRRNLLGGLITGLCFAGISCYGTTEEDIRKTKNGKIIRKLYLHPENWTQKQKEGRNEIRKHFIKKRIPLRLRNRIFEALVYAVKEGKRDHQEIIECANEYLVTFYSEVPNWLDWLRVLLQIMAALLTILIIFI